MMKKFLSALLACLMMLAALAPAALAKGVSIPDFADCAPGLVVFDAEYPEMNMRVYLSDSNDNLAEALGNYMEILSLYGFGGFDADEDSSDTFLYMYLSEYSGSADIRPEYLDDCPVPCYILFAITWMDDCVLAVVMGADGVSFDGTSGAAASLGSTDDGVVFGDGTVIADPVTYTGDLFYCSEKQDYDGRDEAIWRCFKPSGYTGNIFNLAQEYVQDLVDSGYYKLIEEGNTMEWYDWNLKYIGPADIHECDDVLLDYGRMDVQVTIRQPDVFAFWMNPEITFVEDHEKQDGPSYDYDDSYSYDYDDGGHYEYREVEVDCPSCTFGNCSVCGGDGVYERYGEKVPCDPDCRSCDGKGKYTRTERVWVD